MSLLKQACISAVIAAPAFPESRAVPGLSEVQWENCCNYCSTVFLSFRTHCVSGKNYLLSQAGHNWNVNSERQVHYRGFQVNKMSGKLNKYWLCLSDFPRLPVGLLEELVKKHHDSQWYITETLNIYDIPYQSFLLACICLFSRRWIKRATLTQSHMPHRSLLP